MPVTPDPRLVALRRMRVLATALLGLMTLVFLATWFVPQDWPGLGFVRAFAEAGMVGACADWFAVVALFRHPLGVPIPHTAIVPKNKARIAGAMGRFVANNFLTPNVLAQRLAEVDAARWLSQWLAAPENVRRVARVLANSVIEVARALPREQIGELVSESVQRGLAAMPAAPVASNLLAIAWAQGQTQKLVERVLEIVEQALARNKELIRGKIEAGSSRWVPRWFDGVVADRVVNALLATLVDMRDANHPWRQELKQGIEGLIARLSKDPVLAAQLDAAKAELLASPLVQDQIEALWGEIEGRLPLDVASHAERIEQAVVRGLDGASRWIREDPEVANGVNRRLRVLVQRTIAPRRAEIGAFVTQVVENWDVTTLVNRMELQVGRDLQYIRINGTLVGGLVGLLIYSATKWLLPG